MIAVCEQAPVGGETFGGVKMGKESIETADGEVATTIAEKGAGEGGDCSNGVCR